MCEVASLNNIIAKSKCRVLKIEDKSVVGSVAAVNDKGTLTLTDYCLLVSKIEEGKEISILHKPLVVQIL